MKVFFDDRYITLADDCSGNPCNQFGIVLEFSGRKELLRMVKWFEKSPRLQKMLIWHKDFKALRKSFRSCFRMIKAAGGLITNEQGEYLFIFRRGVWDLPKGKLEKFENYEKAAIREVCEECNLKAPVLGRRLATTYHTYRLKNKLILKKTIWFEMKVKSDEMPAPQLIEEITEVKWVPPAALDTVKSNTWASIRELLDNI